MTFNELKYHLPTFILLYGILSFVWRRTRIKRSLTIIKGNLPVLEKLTFLNNLFNVLFLLACGIIFVYAFFNEIYNEFTLPFQALDIVPINNFGIFILNISLVWVVATQMNLDTNVYRMVSGNLDLATAQKIIIYCEKSILIGFIILFVGIFVTISSLGTLLLALIGIWVYYFLFLRKINNNTPKKGTFVL